MGLEVDGTMRWKRWECYGMYVGEVGRYMRLSNDVDEIYIWYQVTNDGFKSIGGSLEENRTADSLEELFQERNAS